MAFYDYFCEANNRTLEVSHPMGVRLKTWGQVCEAACIPLGDTPSGAQVVRLISGMPFLPRCQGLDKDAPSTRLEL